MGAIHFDKPSSGTVDVNKVNALKVTYTGEEGHAFWSETTNEKGGAGVVGVTRKWVGVSGQCTSVNGYAGVHGSNAEPLQPGGAGVVGISVKGNGIYGESQLGHAIWGETKTDKGGAGVVGVSINWHGVDGQSANGIGVYGKGPVAGFFEGKVQVTDDIELLNADCAEEFDIVEENAEAGSVMVLNENGSLESSYQEYDKKVAGIVSGGSGYKPAIVLGSQHSQNQFQNADQNKNNDNKKRRLPIALIGKVYCKVDARHSPIGIGDLLTTSATKGYAMKAEDPMKAFGAVIGKALGSIRQGLGMIPVLVTLQ